MTLSNEDHDEIIEDYTTGNRNVWELERIHGVDRRRIEQIVAEAGYQLRKQPRKGSIRISDLHRRIGTKLIDYRFEKGWDSVDAPTRELALGLTTHSAIKPIDRALRAAILYRKPKLELGRSQ